jgi:hypothetical protein
VIHDGALVSWLGAVRRVSRGGLCWIDGVESGRRAVCHTLRGREALMGASRVCWIQNMTGRGAAALVRS